MIDEKTKKKILILYFELGFTYDGIAQIYDEPVGLIKSIIYEKKVEEKENEQI